MNAKRKIIISVCAFALIVVATVVSVIAVLAAQQVTIQSSVSVTYTVVDVVADVEVYAVETNATSISSWTASNWGTAQTHNFAHNTSTTTQNLALGDFTPTKDECIVFKFVFNNNGDKAFKATLTAPTPHSNMNIYYAATQADLLTSTTTAPAQVSVAKGASSTASYFAVVKIKDVTKEIAKTDLKFSWVLA